MQELSQAVSTHAPQTVPTMAQLQVRSNSMPAAPTHNYQTASSHQARFARVKVSGERAVLVPENGGMWGHALAALISSAMVSA
jgi:hypothetical protein